MSNEAVDVGAESRKEEMRRGSELFVCIRKKRSDCRINILETT